MKKLLGSIFLAATLITIYSGCAKDNDDPAQIPAAGAGGSAEISAYARHHNEPIPAARIFIKYGASSFPGTDTTIYDAVHVCGSTGHGLGHSHIEGLHQGAYWLYAIGYDSTSATIVTGDNDVVLETETDIEEINISLE